MLFVSVNVLKEDGLLAISTIWEEFHPFDELPTKTIILLIKPFYIFSVRSKAVIQKKPMCMKERVVLKHQVCLSWVPPRV